MLDNKRRMAKLVQSLDIELNKAGLEGRIKFGSSIDTIEIIEKLCFDLIHFASQNNLRSIGDSQVNKNNEAVFLQCIKLFLHVNMELSNFSKLLYQGDFPRDVLRSYRQIYESVNAVSNCLFQFESDDEQFLNQKQQLITQSLEQRQVMQKNANLFKERNSKVGEKIYRSQGELIETLNRQIEDLNALIRQNDEDFVQQIQRYNSTLFDMQETIREYEVRLDKVRQYETSIDDLEHKLIRLKQQKYRDDMLIDNMSKKIRLYQKERKGPDTFISPRANQSRKNNIISPSNRISGHNYQNTYGSNGQEEIKYYGQRLIGN